MKGGSAAGYCCYGLIWVGWGGYGGAVSDTHNHKSAISEAVTSERTRHEDDQTMMTHFLKSRMGTSSLL